MSTPSTATFPERLRAAREMRGLSQGGLATRSGLQASAISHFETGSRKPSFDNLRRLADALEVTTDYLLGRVTEPNASASADQLYRDFGKLTSDDRDIAEGFIKLLAKKAHQRRSNE